MARSPMRTLEGNTKSSTPVSLADVHTRLLELNSSLETLEANVAAVYGRLTREERGISGESIKEGERPPIAVLEHNALDMRGRVDALIQKIDVIDALTAF